MKINYDFVIKKDIDTLLDNSISLLIEKLKTKDRAKNKYLKRMKNTKKIRRK